MVPGYAAFQCAFGPLPYAKPTGLLCDCPGMDVVAFRGWPRFIPGLKYGRRTDYIYAGPLPGGGHDCGHSNHTSLQRQSGDRYFRTLGTAAWAAGMCDTLAGLLIDDFVSRWPHAPLKMGSEQGAGTTVTTPAPPGEVASRGAPSDAAIAAHACDRKRKLGSTWARHPLMAGADLSDDEEIDPTNPFTYPRLGWQGSGDPFWVGHRMGTRRPVADGGGLCSPGKWPPERRRLPVWPRPFRDDLLATLAKYDVRAVWLQTSAGKLDASPFDQDDVLGLRSRLQERLVQDGWAPHPKEGDGVQELHIRLIQATLQACGDPDAGIMDWYAEGVPLGVDVRLPRAKGIFFAKAKWSMREQATLDSPDDHPWSGERAVPNHPSGRANVDWVRKHLRGLAEAQPPQGSFMSDEAARAQFGDRLAVAAVGTVHKGWDDLGAEDFRLIHDATHGVHVNHKIKVRDVDEAPSAKDLKRLQAAKSRRKRGVHGLAADAKHAHKLVLIRPQDWGLQACRASDTDPLFINSRGTYGLSSAAYWWGRMGACLVRIAHYVVGTSADPGSPGDLWLTRFADDFDVEAEGDNFPIVIFMVLLAWTVLGVPLAWSKCRGGLRYDWIGYEILLDEYSLGISQKRADWVSGWYVKVLTRGSVSLAELRAAVGRLSFVCGALRYDRPFIAPIYAFVGALARKRQLGADTECRIPPFLRMIFAWLLSKIRQRRHEPCDMRESEGGHLFRVDAKAEGETIVLGGWRPVKRPDGSIDMARSPWFSLRLDRASAPWAYAKSGEPFRVISALELLATTISFMVFSPEAHPGQRQRFGVRVSSWTDSQVSVASTRKGISSAYPMCLAQMELAAQMESKRAILEPEWAPRELNQEADDLTNEIFDAFSPGMRREISVDSLPWLVFPRLVKNSRAFYEGLIASSVREAAAAGGEPMGPPAGSAARFKKKVAGLRESDPW